jgi:hypothetical protein
MLDPVVILIISTAPDGVALGYRYGANSYVAKPLDFDQFSRLLRQLGSYWLAVNEPPPPPLQPLEAAGRSRSRSRGGKPRTLACT